MDFELDETQRIIASSTADVLAGAVSREPASAGRPAGAIRPGAGLAGEDLAAAPSGHGYDLAAWQGLAKAGLLALTLPSWLDGDGLGVIEAAVFLTEVGRRAVTVPALATIMLGVLPVVRWGSQDLQARLLAGVGAGEVLLTGAIREPSTVMPAEPATWVTLSGGAIGSGGWGTVTGTKVGVPYADEAAWILVPARLPAGGSAVVVLDRTAAGISVCRTPASGDTPEFTVRLAATPITGVLGIGERGVARAGAAVQDMYQLAAVGAAASADGAIAGALELTTNYLATREQFGRPLASFQAVAQQVADVYIAGRTLHLAAISACWRLATGRDAADDADIAAYWLAQEAPAALRTCHHLHGGVGMDISYPLHRYSCMVNDLARFVGGAEYRLDLLGERAASDPDDSPGGRTPAADESGGQPPGETSHRTGGLRVVDACLSS